MQKSTFEKAIALNKELEFFRKHKEDLEKSKIEFGGEIIFHYNDHHSDVSLINELYGGNSFFQMYMNNLDDKIKALETEFENL